jgi:hypothetical protein
MVAGFLWLLPLHGQETLPDDVSAFIEQRTLCEHFRAEPWPEGESPEERERREFLILQLQRYCRGSDEQRHLFRERYRGNRAVLQQLGKFESSIEPK